MGAHRAHLRRISVAAPTSARFEPTSRDAATDTLDGRTGGVREEFHYDTAGKLSAVDQVTALAPDGTVTARQRTTVEREVLEQWVRLVGPFGHAIELTLDANGCLRESVDAAGTTTQFVTGATDLLETMTDPNDALTTYTYTTDGQLSGETDAVGGGKALERTVGTTYEGYEVALTTRMSPTTSRTERYQVEALSTGAHRRLNTDAAGLVTDTITQTNGTTTTTVPDGTTTVTTAGPDPRFGMQSPLAKQSTVSTPGGLTASVSRSRSATLIDPSDPLSLLTETDTTTINGRTFTTTFNALALTETTTTPANRRTVTAVDALARPVKSVVTGLHPIRRIYDAQGRLAALKHGPDPDTSETRVTAFTYKNTTDAQNGLLDAITDPLGRVTSFDYDAAGRVTTQTLPDARTIGYTYDVNGNVTSITPPDRPAHEFEYTAVNLEREYRPPQPQPPVSSPQTQYAYNLDRQLDVITRPDGSIIDFTYDYPAISSFHRSAASPFSLARTPTNSIFPNSSRLHRSGRSSIPSPRCARIILRTPLRRSGKLSSPRLSRSSNASRQLSSRRIPFAARRSSQSHTSRDNSVRVRFPSRSIRARILSITAAENLSPAASTTAATHYVYQIRSSVFSGNLWDVISLFQRGLSEVPIVSPGRNWAASGSRMVAGRFSVRRDGVARRPR